MTSDGRHMTPIFSERERKLKEQQKALIVAEREAAANLTKLQLKLDRVTTQLNAAIRRRRYDMPPDGRFPSGDAFRELRRLAETARAALPTHAKPEQLVEAVRILFEAEYGDLTAAAAELNLADEMERYNLAVENQTLAGQRMAVVRAIVDAGRKRRNEPPLREDVVLIGDFKRDKP
jgi:hypothetical protein